MCANGRLRIYSVYRLFSSSFHNSHWIAISLSHAPLTLDRPLLDKTNSRLLFDGHRILDHQTANDLDLEDGDAIEVQLERESFLSTFFPLSPFLVLVV